MNKIKYSTKYVKLLSLSLWEYVGFSVNAGSVVRRKTNQLIFFFFYFQLKQTINIWDDATESSLNMPFNRTLLWLEACSIQAFLHYKVVTSINWIHFNYTLLNSINYARTLTHQRQEHPDAASEPVAPRQTSHWAASPKGLVPKTQGIPYMSQTNNLLIFQLVQKQHKLFILANWPFGFCLRFL